MKKESVLIATLLAAFLLSSQWPAQPATQPAEEDSRAMKKAQEEYGQLNPNAPPELSRFAFLIGRWRCDASLKREDGPWEGLKAIWEGRYILDGYVIADEYRMTRPTGELLVLGINLRAYDAKKKTWAMKWLNALAGTWFDLGPEELGGVQADEKAITYVIHEPVGPHKFTRATYTNISEDHFTWRGERSNDGKQWEEFLVIEVYRRDD